MVDKFRNFFRPFYKRSILMQAFVGAIRTQRCIREAQKGGLPFNGDSILIQTIDYLITYAAVTEFVETGTYLGYTTSYLGERYPALPIITIENNSDFYKASQMILKRYGNIRQIFGNSPDVLEEFTRGMTGMPMFFLDAHWYDYLPLPDEIRIIGNNLQDAIYVIHDFQIPERDDFTFDICNNQIIGLDLLRESVIPNHIYHVWLPSYGYKEAYDAGNPGQKVRGYAFVFQNAIAASTCFENSNFIQYLRQNRLS